MFKDFLNSRILPTRLHRLADCLLINMFNGFFGTHHKMLFTASPESNPGRYEEANYPLTDDDSTLAWKPLDTEKI